MIDENPHPCDDDGGAGAGLDRVADRFDLRAAQIGAQAWVCAAIPNARLVESLPDLPAAAQPSAGRIAMGCGVSLAACRTSALGEAVELASACAWGDEALVEARPEDLGGAAILPEAINGLSAAQVAARGVWNAAYGRFDWRPAPRGPGPLHWIAARDAVDGGTVHVPADAVLIGRREAGDAAAVAIADSNGCAAGPTPDAARLAALLELVERDATGRWWYGRRRRAVLGDAVLARWAGLSQWLRARRRRTVLLDITSDVGVPVVAAASMDADVPGLALGFAARFDRAEAALAATVEMLAVETSLPPRAAPPAEGALRAWLDTGAAGLPPFDTTSAPAVAEGPPVPDGLAWLVGRVAQAAGRVAFVDLTRAAFGIPVFRAVAPGLCHYKPRFGKARLLAADDRDLPPRADGGVTPNPVPLLI